MNQHIKYVSVGMAVSTLFFIMSGVVTAVLPNPVFVRMLPIKIVDYMFLTTSSVLIGAYVGVHLYKKKNMKSCNTAASMGGIGSFLAVACPVCNKLLLFLFGFIALMTYVEPYRPVLGVASTALLGGTVYWRIRN